MSSLFYPTLTTRGPGRYLNQSDFPTNNQSRNIGGVTSQTAFTTASSGGTGVTLNRLTNGPNQAPISDGGTGLRLSANTGNTLVAAFGDQIVVDDHIGNNTYCAMTTGTDAGVFNGINQQFAWSRDPASNSKFIFGSDSAWDDGWCCAYWVRLRNNATSQNSPGTPFAWGSTVTDANGNNARNNFSIYGARGHGNRLVYRHSTGTTSAGNLVFRRDFSAGNDVVLTNQPTANTDWVHIAIRRSAGGSSAGQDTGTYRVWVNGVGEDITSITGAFGTGGGDLRVGYTFGGGGTNLPMTLTADTSEIWVTSVDSTGYSGSLWDDAQVKKMYEIGKGIFVIPNFTTQTKANNAGYGTFTWEAPIGVEKINLTAAGAGGGGGNFSFANNVSTNRACSGGGGGGGAAWLFEEDVTVVPGETYTFVCVDGTNNADGTGTTISGIINGSVEAVVNINGGGVGGDGTTANDNTSGGAGGTAGIGETTGGEITTSGAAGGGGGGTSGGVASGFPGSAGGNTTVDSMTISGGAGGSGGSARRRGGGGGGGASLTTGGDGGGGSNAAAAGNSGGGGGGAGFLAGVAGGTGLRGTGGGGGFSFTYSLSKDSTDNPLIGP